MELKTVKSSFTDQEPDFHRETELKKRGLNEKAFNLVLTGQAFNLIETTQYSEKCPGLKLEDLPFTLIATIKISTPAELEITWYDT